MNRHAHVALLSTVLMCVSLGCSSKGEIDTVPVTGKVMRNGSPVANASVVFNPVSQGPLAVGQTDDNGKFVLKTNKLDGAKPGDYKITVVPKTGGDSAEMPGGAREADAAARKKKKAAFPEKYTRVESTPLKETVASSGTNEFTLEIKD